MSVNNQTGSQVIWKSDRYGVTKWAHRQRVTKWAHRQRVTKWEHTQTFCYKVGTHTDMLLQSGPTLHRQTCCYIVGPQTDR